jgi:hypothetical protein
MRKDYAAQAGGDIKDCKLLKAKKINFWEKIYIASRRQGNCNMLV